MIKINNKCTAQRSVFACIHNTMTFTSLQMDQCSSHWPWENACLPVVRQEGALCKVQLEKCWWDVLCSRRHVWTIMGSLWSRHVLFSHRVHLRLTPCPQWITLTIRVCYVCSPNYILSMPFESPKSVREKICGIEITWLKRRKLKTV